MAPVLECINSMGMVRKSPLFSKKGVECPGLKGPEGYSRMVNLSVGFRLDAWFPPGT